MYSSQIGIYIWSIDTLTREDSCTETWLVATNVFRCVRWLMHRKKTRYHTRMHMYQMTRHHKCIQMYHYNCIHMYQRTRENKCMHMYQRTRYHKFIHLYHHKCIHMYQWLVTTSASRCITTTTCICIKGLVTTGASICIKWLKHRDMARRHKRIHMCEITHA